MSYYNKTVYINFKIEVNYKQIIQILTVGPGSKQRTCWGHYSAVMSL